MRVLVVDDEQPVREIVAALLERLGHIAETAVDGREALRKFEATDFQLVFVDFQMPGMNGDELARELKQRKPAVPVVLITGSRTHTISTAIDRVLFKPFSMAQLRSTICSLS